MNIIDATPPADYPDQVVVAQDAAFAARNPSAAYWLRVKLQDNGVGVHQLAGAVGPAHARQMARALDFAPTHGRICSDLGKAPGAPDSLPAAGE